MVVIKRSQQGVGMIEVLIALLLLALGVIGFSFLQLRAVDATNEALSRVQAMNIARDLAERIRINPYALTLLKIDNSKIVSSTDQSAYSSAVSTNRNSTTAYNWSSSTACYNASPCTSAAMAVEDVKQVVYKAHQQGMTINLIPCQAPVTTTSGETSTTTSGSISSGRQCIYVAWDKTTPTNVNIDSDTACTKNGSYQSDSKCIVLEAY